MKRTICALLLAGLMLCLCACGSSKKGEPDIPALTASLLDSGAFSTALQELPESKAAVFYGLEPEDISAAVMYHASGISKEQLAVFTAVDEAAAGRVMDALRGLIEEWIESDRNYAPAEVPKLEKAILRRVGNQVILVVANAPETAASLVDKAL